MNFQWKPLNGPDSDAIERMKQHFKKPVNDPPEAWFISEKQRYFSGLAEAITTVPNLTYIEHYLLDTGAGLKNFGRLEEWVEWYLFLLPHLLNHILDRGLLCPTISYFLNLYPQEIPDEYPGFREDVLQTLGQVIMSDFIWTERKYDDWYLGEQLYAALFFCLKYLRPAEIDGWVASIEIIQDAAWRRAVLKWIRGLKRFLYLIGHPEDVPVPSEEWEMSEMDTLQYRLEVAGISWESSHVVFARSYSSLPDCLPARNLAAFWAGLESQFNEAI